MITIVGVFERIGAAARAVRDLRIVGTGAGKVQFLRPGGGPTQFAHVPAAAGEPPGMAQTMAAFLAGSVGAAAGLALGAAAAGALMPGAGPDLALGLIGAVAFGLTGAVAGSAAGSRLGSAIFEGLPEDEFFVYKDALRQSRWIVLCLAGKQTAADEARQILEREGAESIDAARHVPELGLKDSALLRYSAPARPPKAENDPFRRGYEAALNPEFRGKPWDQVVYLLAERYANWYDDAFREGFDGGQRRGQALMNAR